MLYKYLKAERAALRADALEHPNYFALDEEAQRLYAQLTPVEYVLANVVHWLWLPYIVGLTVWGFCTVRWRPYDGEDREDL